MIKKIKFLFSRKAAIMLMLILQILFLILTVIKLRENFAMAYAGFVLLSLFTVYMVILSDESPEYKLAWVIPILIFPIFGGLAYVILNTQHDNRIFRKNVNNRLQNSRKYLVQNERIVMRLKEMDHDTARLAEYMHKCCGYPIYRNTKISYFKIGEEKFEAMKSELKKAEHFIFMEYFIIDNGEMWSEILEILKEKAAEGVDVRLIYDGFGTQFILPSRYEKKLAAMGIKCKIFNPFRPLLSSSQNNRDHRKILVIDGITAFNGGINIADEYINKKVRFGHWKDTAVMIKGEAVWSFTMMFMQMWTLDIQDHDEDYTKFMPYAHRGKMFESDGFVMPYGDNPTDNERAGKTAYLNIIHNAKDYVYITTPYLIPDTELISALCYAAKSGIDVKIITPGIPDKWYVDCITKSYYKVLIDAGVKIYEYEKGFIHAKNFVSDDTKAVVGTINLDYRSLYLHFECATFMYGTECVSDIKDDFIKTLSKCREITPEALKQFPLSIKIRGGILKPFSPLL